MYNVKKTVKIAKNKTIIKENVIFLAKIEYYKIID